jgi:hypothetical protein
LRGAAVSGETGNAGSLSGFLDALFVAVAGFDFWGCLVFDISGLLRWVATASRAVTTEAPRRPESAGGEGVRGGKRSGVAEPVDHAASCAEESGYFVGDLLDIEHDSKVFLDIT